MDVRAWVLIYAPKCFFFQGLEGLTECFGLWTSTRMTPGCPLDACLERLLWAVFRS